MNKIKLLETAKTMAVKAKPFVGPVIVSLATAVAGVITEQKAEARLLGMENRIKDLENLLNK